MVWRPIALLAAALSSRKSSAAWSKTIAQTHASLATVR